MWSGKSASDRKMNSAGLAVVVVLHAVVIWGLLSHGLIPVPKETMTLFVSFIAPESGPRVAEPTKPTPPKVRPVDEPRQLVAEAPAVAPTNYVAPPSVQAAPAIEGATNAAQMAIGPVALGSELSIACNERTPPTYPPLSRRFNEEGTVTLRVELDEQGHISNAYVANSSNYQRLDEAALTAIRSWRCAPARRNGQPVRATAMQPFKFVLQGN